MYISTKALCNEMKEKKKLVQRQQVNFIYQQIWSKQLNQLKLNSIFWVVS